MADPGYTFDVPGTPFFYDGNPRRIDYIFAKGAPYEVVASSVVLNGASGGFMSDHCGVLSQISVRALWGQTHKRGYLPPPVSSLNLSKTAPVIEALAGGAARSCAAFVKTVPKDSCCPADRSPCLNPGNPLDKGANLG